MANTKHCLISTSYYRSMEYPGNLIVIVAPSGTGKSSLIRALLEKDKELSFSISFTTRKPRASEACGKDYFFIDARQFEMMIQQGELLEWAKVHSNLYGTSKKWISDKMLLGRDVLLELDWQGALQIRGIFDNATLVFILPPSITELERRLKERDEDSAEIIQKRLINAREEISHAHCFDFTIINEQFHDALNDLYLIVQTQRLRYSSQKIRRADVFTNLNL